MVGPVVHRKQLSVTEADRLLALNELHVPAVNSIPLSQLQWFVDHADLFGLYFADTDTAPNSEQTIAGMIIAMAPGHDYQSLNYQYFCAQYRSFLYVDRIVVDDHYQGRGIGQQIYAHLEEVGRQTGVEHLCCEVNLKPPNPSSLRFHERQGFSHIASQETEGGAKEVALLVKSL